MPWYPPYPGIGGVMLMTLIDTWLATRRASGFALRKYERHLRRFAEFAAARGDDHVRAETALAWASHAATPGQRCRHFQRVVQLAGAGARSEVAVCFTSCRSAQRRPGKLSASVWRLPR